MRERYLCMLDLRDQLVMLCDLCGMESETVKISPRPAVLQWLEKLIQDNELYDYLENLTAMSAGAVERMKEINLELWNGRENEKLIEQLNERLEQKEETVARLEAELSGLRTLLRQEQEKSIQSLITLRDNLLMKKEWAESSMPGDSAAVKLILGQLQETAKLLTDMGVEILEDTGAFDSACHTAVQTRPAQAPEQEDQIAETFRPGYRFRGETLRPQEVIVYTKVQEDGVCP